MIINFHVNQHYLLCLLNHAIILQRIERVRCGGGKRKDKIKYHEKETPIKGYAVYFEAVSGSETSLWAACPSVVGQSVGLSSLCPKKGGSSTSP